MLYRVIFNLFFKRLDPEFAHELVVFGLRALAALGLLRARKAKPEFELMGLKLENRFGMAAGFDKNAKLIKPLHALGFGHVEIGTVTPKPQPGNAKPRLFRLPKNHALINRMGFNNDGVSAIADRLKALRSSSAPLPVIGVNIGKNKLTSAEDAASDYDIASKALAPYADYLVVNVSSPNTPGLRDLQQIESLRPILAAVLRNSLGKPVLVKIAPDLAEQDIADVCSLVKELGLAGVVATNTTISRVGLQPEPHIDEIGGLSGPILKDASTQVLTLVRRELGPQKLVIGVGGVSSKADFEEKLEAGADLVQAYTGFVYGGPLWPRRIAS